MSSLLTTIRRYHDNSCFERINFFFQTLYEMRTNSSNSNFSNLTKPNTNVLVFFFVFIFLLFLFNILNFAFLFTFFLSQLTFVHSFVFSNHQVSFHFCSSCILRDSVFFLNISHKKHYFHFVNRISNTSKDQTTTVLHLSPFLQATRSLNLTIETTKNED